MYVVLWQYTVSPDKRDEFERVYGPSGDWVRLFRRAVGYQETTLLRDSNVPGRYVTIDRWMAPADHETFQSMWSEQYGLLDHRCEHLTESETYVGSFEPV